VSPPAQPGFYLKEIIDAIVDYVKKGIVGVYNRNNYDNETWK